MDIDVNLFYTDAKESFAKMRFSEINDVEKLFDYVQDEVFQEYKDAAVVSENIANMPCIESEEPKYSIGIHFNRIGDTTNLTSQIDKLFKNCKHYTPIGARISER